MVSFFKMDDIDQLSHVDRDQSICSRAAITGIELYNTLDPLSELQYDGTEEAESAKFIVSIANQAAMLGFLWAKAEAEINLKPLAKSALLRKDSNILGGSASGDSRRKKAEIGWKAIARHMAFEIRSEHPDYSQDKVVKSIWLDWDPKTKVKCPESPTLKKFVSDLEKFDKLPPMRKNSTKRAFREAAE
jgi:hypothetical protein